MKDSLVQSITHTLVNACFLTVLHRHADGRWEQHGTQPVATVAAVKSTLSAILEKLHFQGNWGGIQDILIRDDRNRVWILHAIQAVGEEALIAVGPLGSPGPWTVGQVLAILGSSVEVAIPTPVDGSDSVERRSAFDRRGAQGVERQFRTAILDALRMGDQPTLRLLIERATAQRPQAAAKRTHEEEMARATAFITLCEEAAIQGGLDPMVVEEIGEHFTALVKRSQNLKEAPLMMLPMVNLLAEQVHRLPYRRMSAKSRAMIRFVKENLDRPITLSQAAVAVGLSTNYAGSLIKREAHEKFSTLVQRIRVQQAQFLLRSTELSVAEIAHRVGYLHANQFARSFRSLTGQSPRDFRWSQPVIVDLVPFSPDSFLTDP